MVYMLAHTWDRGGDERNETWEHIPQATGHDNQFLSHLWVSFSMDKCSTKTIPSPILRKILPKDAQLIQQTGELKLTELPQATTA